MLPPGVPYQFVVVSGGVATKLAEVALVGSVVGTKVFGQMGLLGVLFAGAQGAQVVLFNHHFTLKLL